MAFSHDAKICLRTLGWALVAILFLMGVPLLWAASPLILLAVIVAGAVIGISLHWLCIRFRHGVQSGSRAGAMLAGVGFLTGLVALPLWWLILQPALHPLTVPRITLGDGKRQVVFQGMVHVGSEQFYRSVCPADHRHCADDKQPPDIALPHLRCSAQDLLAPGRMLSWHQAQPGREISAALEH